MKKVLIVIPSYSKGGGAEKILSNILNNGDFSGYQIDIVEIDRGYNGIEVLPRNIKVIFWKVLWKILMLMEKYIQFHSKEVQWFYFTISK